MRVKTIIIIVITVLLTIGIMQNTDAVPFSFLFAKFYMSKLVMILIVAFIGFIAGVLIARPRKPKYVPGQVENTDQQKTNPAH